MTPCLLCLYCNCFCFWRNKYSSSGARLSTPSRGHPRNFWLARTAPGGCQTGEPVYMLATHDENEIVMDCFIAMTSTCTMQIAPSPVTTTAPLCGAYCLPLVQLADLSGCMSVHDGCLTGIQSAFTGARRALKARRQCSHAACYHHPPATDQPQVGGLHNLTSRQ